LYPKSQRRTGWFISGILEKNTNCQKFEMYDFHRYTEEGNQENGLVINRNGELKTLSITQSIIEK
jgi:hypothetical protein